MKRLVTKQQDRPRTAAQSISADNSEFTRLVGMDLGDKLADKLCEAKQPEPPSNGANHG